MIGGVSPSLVCSSLFLALGVAFQFDNKPALTSIPHGRWAEYDGGMADRIQRSLPLRCDCGSRGAAIFEEDDTRADDRNTVLIDVRGPYRHADGKFTCLACA